MISRPSPPTFTRRGAFGPGSAGSCAPRTPPHASVGCFIRPLSNRCCCLGVKPGAYCRRHGSGSRGPISRPRGGWQMRIGHGGGPTGCGSTRPRRTSWRRWACTRSIIILMRAGPPSPGISPTGQSFGTVRRGLGGEGPPHICGGGSNRCSWRLMPTGRMLWT